MNLLPSLKRERIMSAVAAGTGDTQYSRAFHIGSGLGVLIDAYIEAVATGGSGKVFLQCSADGSTSWKTMVDQYGEAIEKAFTDSDGSKMVTMDVYDIPPDYPYFRIGITRVDANVTISGAGIGVYGSRKLPVTHGDYVVAANSGKPFIAPAVSS